MRDKILLHICCAPDATYPFLELSKEFEVIGYFYGSNIHPKSEYNRRLEAINRLSQSWDFPIIVGIYDPKAWFKIVKGLEREPEGGKRCETCFYIQLKEAARIAKESSIGIFTTTLTISPHKDVKLINRVGKDIAKEIKVEFLERVFRKANGFQKSVKLSKDLNLYRQNYCGCIFSLIGRRINHGTR